MAFGFLKSLDADDIFISYSRADGSAYVAGLDAALSTKGFSCFTDRRGTDANHLPPETLLARIRLCKTLVLLATPGALARSEYIAEELKEFAGANGTARIICVSFDGEVELLDWPSTVAWRTYVQGKAREREDSAALRTGEPSTSIVDSIVTACNYMKSKDRLRKYRNRAIFSLSILLVAGIAAGIVASLQFGRAAEAAAEAQKQSTRAGIESERAAKAAAEAQKQSTRAETETARAASATSEAQRQSDISESRSLANRSQVLLRQRPDELPQAAKIAIKAMKTALSRAVHTVEADSAIREVIAALPLLRSNARYDRDRVITLSLAFSPDGQLFAILTSDAILRVYDSAGSDSFRIRKAIGELRCDCSAVALSNDKHIAAITKKGAVRLLDLKDATKDHLIPLNGLSNRSRIALSPGGRHIALSARRKDDGRLDRVVVLESATGHPVKTYEDANLSVEDIQFGSTGILAIGGGYGTVEASTGRIILWPLPLDPAKTRAEPTLTEASFESPQIIPQRDAVQAVAPGTDTTFLATNGGVWRRRPSAIDYGLVARLPYFRDFPSNSFINKLAFGSDGRTLFVARTIDARDQNNNDLDESVLELWDTGSKELANVRLRKEVDRLGFRLAKSSAPPTKNDEAEPILGFVSATGEQWDIVTSKFDSREQAYVSPDGRYVIRRARGTAVVDSWAERTLSLPFVGTSKEIRAAATSPDARFAALFSAARRGKPALTIYQRDDASYREETTIPQAEADLEEAVGLALSSDGSRVAAHYTYAERFVRIWDVQNGKDVSPPALADTGDIIEMTFSRDGRLLALADSDQQTHLIDLLDGQEAKLTPLATNLETTCMAFSADARFVAVGSGDGVVLVLQTSRPESEIARLEHAGPITAISFSDDGRYIATASSEPNAHDSGRTYPIRIWSLWGTDLIEEAEKRVRPFNLRP